MSTLSKEYILGFEPRLEYFSSYPYLSAEYFESQAIFKKAWIGARVTADPGTAGYCLTYEVAHA
jgi:hypothetical protein